MATTTDPTPTETAGENLYLIPSALRLLRQVWQGRVVWARRGRTGAPVFHIDDQPASTIVDIEMRWLHDNGYIERAPLLVDDEWSVERTTDLGDRVLAHWGADRGRLHDMTAAESRALTERVVSAQG